MTPPRTTPPPSRPPRLVLRLAALLLAVTSAAIAAQPPSATVAANQTGGLRFATASAEERAAALITAQHELFQLGLVNLEVGPPLAVFVLETGKERLTDAVAEGIVYPITCFGSPVHQVHFSSGRVSAYLHPGDGEAVATALARFATEARVRAGVFEPRLLHMPADHGRGKEAITALWLRPAAGDGDLVCLPGPAVWPGLESGKLYPAAEFLRAVLPTAAELEEIKKREAADQKMLAATAERREQPAISSRQNATPAPPVRGPGSPPAAGRPFSVPLGGGIGLDLVWLAPGSFTMGPQPGPGQTAFEAEFFREFYPPTRVTLTQGFWLGKFTVTQAQYTALMGSDLGQIRRERFPTNESGLKENPPRGTGPDLPAYYISREMALEFCRKLTLQERAAGRLPFGHEYTLPTEAQWEYAARAGTTTRFYNGDDPARLDEIAWFTRTPKIKDHPGGRAEYAQPPRDTPVHPVGRKQPNAWGLYDMLGNVAQWCADTYYSKGGELGHPGGAFVDFFRNVPDDAGPFDGPFNYRAGTLRGGSVMDREMGAGDSSTWERVAGFRVALTAMPRPPSAQTGPRPPPPVVFAVPQPAETATQRLLTLQAKLQAALALLEKVPAGPGEPGTLLGPVVADVGRALPLVAAALEHVRAHPASDALLVSAVVPGRNNSYGSFYFSNEESAKKYLDLTTANAQLDTLLHSWLTGFPPAEYWAGPPGPVVGELGGFRDQLVRVLGEIQAGLRDAARAYDRIQAHAPAVLPAAAETASVAGTGSISGVALDSDGRPLAHVLITVAARTSEAKLRAAAIARYTPPPPGTPVAGFQADLARMTDAQRQAAIEQDAAEFQWEEPRPVALTDGSGRFVVSGLAPGSYAVTGVAVLARAGESVGGSAGGWPLSLAQPLTPDLNGSHSDRSRPATMVRAGEETKLSGPLTQLSDSLFF
jgi:formylglycine-generating enzyme required for sulfatase activity